jgi:hypothetical protein
MSAKEGWNDLRRRLPSMNCVYVRQRVLRWSILGLLTGISSTGIALLGRQSPSSGGSKSPGFGAGHMIKAKPNEPIARPEGSPDAVGQVESPEQSRNQ